MIIPKRKVDKMLNMIKLRNENYMVLLWIKGLNRTFPTNNELFWDVEMKYGDFGNSTKKGKPNWACLLGLNYRKWKI